VSRTLIASLVIVALASAGWFASQGTGEATHSWGGYHWARTSNPFTVKLVDSASPGWDTYLSTASADWSASSVLDTTVVPGNTDSFTQRRCNPVSGQVRVCNYTYGNNGWLGIASIWLSGNHIVQGTVKNNDTYFNTASYNTPAWRQFVMCQEIGHTFGLGHVNEVFNDPNTGSCMDYTNDPDGGAGGVSSSDPSNEHPNTHDYELLASIYAHTDGSTTVKSTTTSGGPGNSNGAGAGADGDATDAVPAGASAKDGRVFSRDLGGGRRVVSVVIWASDFPGSGAPGRNHAE
jgi:hypothetical protein